MKLAWVALQVGDLLSTIYFLDHGMSEANPLVAWLISLSSPVAALVVIKSAAAAAVIPMRTRGLVRAGVLIGAAVLGWNVLAIALTAQGL